MLENFHIASNLEGNKLFYRVDDQEKLLPPKVEIEIEDKSNNWYKTIGSMAVFVALLIIIGLDTVLVLLLIGVMFLHEMGHFVAMKIFGYKNVSMFFVPLLGAYVSGEKQKVSQKQEMITLLAGPVPGIILGMILILPFFAGDVPVIYGLTTALRLGFILLMLNVLNMLPFFPLDGGRILEILFTRGNLWIRSGLIAAFLILNIYYLITTGSMIAVVVAVLLSTLLYANWQIIRERMEIRKIGISPGTHIDACSRQEYWKMHYFIAQRNPNLQTKQQIVRKLSSIIPYSPEEKMGIGEKAFFFVLWIFFLVMPLLQFYFLYAEYLPYMQFG